MSPEGTDELDSSTTRPTPARRTSASRPGMSAYPLSRNTPCTPRNEPATVSGRSRSPVTTSTPGAQPAGADGCADRDRARTAWPRAASALTTAPPTLPVAPATRNVTSDSLA